MGPLKWMRLRKRDANDGRALPADDAIDIVNRNNRPVVRDQYSDETDLLVADGTPVNSVARVVTLANTGVGIDGEVFAIGDYYFELNASDGTTVSNAGDVGVPAKGTITLTGVPTAAETLTIGSKVYTFRAIADYDADAEIAIAPVNDPDGNPYTTAERISIQASYIVSAVNGTDGYNTAHAQVTALKVGSTVVLTSKFVGAGSDAIVLSDTATNLTVDGAGTLGGTQAGVDPEYLPIDITGTAVKSQGILTIAGLPVADEELILGATTYTFKAEAAAAGQITIGSNTLELAANIIAAVNGTDSLNTANASASAASGGVGEVVFTALVGGVAGDLIPFDATGATNLTGDDDGGSQLLGVETAGVDSTDAEVVDAVVATFTALHTSGEIPFTAVDATASATITMDQHGTIPNAYPLYEAMANATLTQTTAGVDGTAGIEGAQMKDGNFLWVLDTVDAENDSFSWTWSQTSGTNSGSTTVAGGVLAIPLTHRVVHKTTSAPEALTLADGEPGQEITIILAVDGGDGTLTPATSTHFSTIVFADALDAATLLYVNDTDGWIITGLSGAAGPPVHT